MNEPAAFDTNQDKPFNYPPDKPAWNLKCPVNEWDDPPYITRTQIVTDYNILQLKISSFQKYRLLVPPRNDCRTKQFAWWVVKGKMINTFIMTFTISTDGVKQNQHMCT